MCHLLVVHSHVIMHMLYSSCGNQQKLSFLASENNGIFVSLVSNNQLIRGTGQGL